MFVTTAARELLLHGPKAQRPVNQLSTGEMIDEFPPSTKETRADGFRQAASGEAAIAAKAVSQLGEMD